MSKKLYEILTCSGIGQTMQQAYEDAIKNIKKPECTKIFSVIYMDNDNCKSNCFFSEDPKNQINTDNNNIKICDLIKATIDYKVYNYIQTTLDKYNKN